MVTQKAAKFLLTPPAPAAARPFGQAISSHVETRISKPVSQAKVKKFKGSMASAITLDRDAINAAHPAWNARWSETMAR